MQLWSAIEARRLLFYVATLSIFFLFLHCFFLLNSSNSTGSSIIVSEPAFTLMLPNNNNTSVSKTIATSGSKPRRSREVVEVVKRRKHSSCGSNESVLKVYMYELPPEFHFGLLGWKGRRRNQTWPDVTDTHHVPSYPGGLNLQHSVEYWLTLDLLLSSSSAANRRPCRGGALRVDDSSLADVVFVPFFASVSYNRHSKAKGRASRNRVLQGELVKFLTGREEWRRCGGRDHVIVAHHPNSMLEARRKLGSAVFLLADFGRYPAEIANLEKDVVAPYVHVVGSVGKKNSKPFEGRPTLVYFQGAIYRKDNGIIRQELYQLLKDEKDVHFAYGSARGNGIRHAGQGMASSRFCLSIAGDTPSSNRLFDAIVSHCVPVIISDDIELPFEDVLDYSEFAVFVRAADAVKKGFLMNLLRKGITREEWTEMWKKLKNIAHHFEYQYPSREGDAVQMIWEAVARKLSPLRLRINKERRYNFSG